MITTITTSTISTITTVTSSVTATISLGVIFGVVAVVTLLLFLCVKELAAASTGNSQKVLARFLDVGIIPLAIAFVLIVAVKVLEMLP